MCVFTCLSKNKYKLSLSLSLSLSIYLSLSPYIYYIKAFEVGPSCRIRLMTLSFIHR